MAQIELQASISRFYHSGEHASGLHLVDLNMYDSSLFANACIFQCDECLVIIDPGTSNTVSQIVNYLRFNKISTQRVLLVPSHHHFDHAGGLGSILRHFKKEGKQVTVVTTPRMAPLLQNLPAGIANARNQFGKMVGTVLPVPLEDIEVIDNEESMRLDDASELRLLETPGHCSDHVSPIITMPDKPAIVFFGEALGINLIKKLSPLPASTAPEFNSQDYIHSIRQISELGAGIGIFSHVGGIRGRKTIASTCELALDRLQEVTQFIKDAFSEGTTSTSDLVSVATRKYHEYIATCVMDEKIVNNLGFLLVYGILKDLGLK